MRVNRWIRIATVAILLFLVSPSTIQADVGNTGGFGSGDSGSSSGSSSGSGWDYSWDDSSQSNYSYSSSTMGILPVIIIYSPFFIAMIFGGSSNLVARYKGNQRRRAKDLRIRKESNFDYNSIDEDSIIKQIISVDPTFSESEFKTYASKSFLGVQRGWAGRSVEAVNDFTTKALSEKFKLQIADHRANDLQNFIRDQKIHDITISGYHVDDIQEIVTVRLNVSLIDFLAETKNYDVIDGSRKIVQDRTYYLEFTRPVEQALDSKEIKTCQNCGAPLSNNIVHECEFCHSILESDRPIRDDWQLNKYDPWVWK